MPQAKLNLRRSRKAIPSGRARLRPSRGSRSDPEIARTEPTLTTSDQIGAFMNASDPICSVVKRYSDALGWRHEAGGRPIFSVHKRSSRYSLLQPVSRATWGKKQPARPLHVR